jgi:hypothetical protein
MTHPTSLQHLFLTVCREVLERNNCFGVRGELSVFSPALVVWLNISKRYGDGSLSDANAELQQMIDTGAVNDFVDRATRSLRKGSVSANTGGISRATSRLKEELVKELFIACASNIQAHVISQGGTYQNIFILDGAVLTVAHTEATAAAYPRSNNRENTLYYPKVRVLTAHQLDTGIAPVIAIGDYKTHELVLAAQVIDQIPSGATLIMDRGFGSAALVAYAEERGISVVVRIKEQAAKKLLEQANARGAVKWSSKPQDSKTAPAVVKGNCYCIKIDDPTIRSDEIYLFTNAKLSAKQAGNLYSKRVQVEVAIRTLKQTLKLSFIRAKTPENIRKEIYITYLSFNLMQATMVEAARVTKVDITKISFSTTRRLMNVYAPLLLTADESKVPELLQRFFTCIGQAKLPTRTKRRSYPREVKLPCRKYTAAATIPREKKETENA